MADIAYQVSQTTATIPEPFAGVDDWMDVTAWKVTRREGQSGTTFARYRYKATAEAVAAILTALSDKEI